MTLDVGTDAALSQDTGTQDQKTVETTTASWRDTLPEDLKASPVLAKYQDQNAAIKALVGAQELIGKKTAGIVKPGPDAKPEDIAEYYKALGRPDTPDAYVMPTFEGLPDGYGISPEVEKVAREALHGLGLSQDQYAGAMKALVADSLKNYQAKEQFRASESKAFLEAHGDKAQEVLKSAESVIRSIGGDDLLKALNETEAVNRKVVMEAFAGLAPHFGEGGMKGSPGSGPGAKNFNDLPPAERIAAAREAGYK